MGNYEELAKKVLCYCICVDIARTALTALGSVNAVDKAQVTMSCYDHVVAAAKDAAKGGNN